MVKPHRVPQSVFDVEFKLFDIMSMKQFVIVMVTAGFAVAFYFLLDKITAPFIKWLIVITIVIVGLVVAFLKVQGEPFEVYVTNFLLALVSPQRRVWSKTNELPEYLKDSNKPTVQQTTALAEKAQKATAPQLSAETLQAVAAAQEKARAQQNARPTTEMDIIEKEYLEGKLPVFGAVKQAPAPAPQPAVQQSTPTAPQPQFAPAPVPQQQPTIEPAPAPEPVFQPEPQQVPVSTQTQAQPQMNIGDQLVPIESLNSSAATPPQNALRPNVLSGEIYSSDGKPLSTTIINIRQENGPIIRALTSNALGQFASSDPLQNGRYVLELVKPGYKFPKYKVECAGTLIPSKRYLGTIPQ